MFVQSPCYYFTFYTKNYLNQSCTFFQDHFTTLKQVAFCRSHLTSSCILHTRYYGRIRRWNSLKRYNFHTKLPLNQSKRWNGGPHGRSHKLIFPSWKWANINNNSLCRTVQRTGKVLLSLFWFIRGLSKQVFVQQATTPSFHPQTPSLGSWEDIQTAKRFSSCDLLTINSEPASIPQLPVQGFSASRNSGLAELPVSFLSRRFIVQCKTRALSPPPDYSGYRPSEISNGSCP
jgi:hypothetical protein